MIVSRWFPGFVVPPVMSLARRAEQISVRVHGHLTARAVIYRRGESEIPIQATPLSIAHTLDQGDGARIRIQQPHWLLPPETLDFGDGPCRPQLGDQIIDGTSTHEVQGSARNQAWEWETAEQLRFKVRTVIQ